jgi:hypothetical protein
VRQHVEDLGAEPPLDLRIAADVAPQVDLGDLERAGQRRLPELAIGVAGNASEFKPPLNRS